MTWGTRIKLAVVMFVLLLAIDRAVLHTLEARQPPVQPIIRLHNIPRPITFPDGCTFIAEFIQDGTVYFRFDAARSSPNCTYKGLRI